MKALLSIKPEFVEEIVSGSKRFEYRKVSFKQEVESVVVYACMPVGKIVGEFIVGDIISMNPSDLWRTTKDYSGISYKFFRQYFKGRKNAYAIQIKEYIPYEEPIDPYKEYKHFVPPQSYRYLADV